MVMDEERKLQADIFLGLKQRLYFPTLHLPYRCALFAVCCVLCVQRACLHECVGPHASARGLCFPTAKTGLDPCFDFLSA